MNTRPVLDSDTGPFVLSVSFNDDCSFFSAALETGFRVYCATSCDEQIAREVGGGIGCAELLGKKSYIGLVGGGRQPKYPQNKVCPEDSGWLLVNDADIIYEVQIWNDKMRRFTTSVEFKTPVQRVRLSQTHLVVALLNSVNIYRMKIPPEKVAEYETVDNPFGLCELGNDIVAFPGRRAGQVKIFDLKTTNVSIISAHTNPLRAIAISRDGQLIATASEQGTLLKVYSFPSCTSLVELRRGLDPAAIFSLAFSPDGSTLAVTSDKSTLHIFDLKTATTATPEGNPKQNKYGFLAHIPVLPRHFSDAYPTASIKFNMGEEPLTWGPHLRSATMSAGIPGVPGGRPTKGLIGWLDDETIAVLGAGQDARWERFQTGVDDKGNKCLALTGWRRYIA
ncbi:WD40 repeat-like protein [Decorospora gaudefroyi]|uniref:WD40 repeat-like protein n=1 Tax=Decorospora gaudefroyi TaxID=184978 RepID=A0A6A5KX42_9PLEO|nr:WD40 repeat-like protein [Decorospora gaudefroyi]